MLTAKTIGLQRSDTWLFRQVTFSVSRGECWHITGPNGSGKTTLLRVLAGLMAVDEGEICLAPYTVPYYFSSPPALLPELSVWEYCCHQLALLWENMPTNCQLRAVLDHWALTPCIHRLMGSLSQGQQQRVALALLQLSTAPLWYLDEPAQALDSAGLQTLWALCRAHQANQGAILLTTHQLPSDRALITHTMTLGS